MDKEAYYAQIAALTYQNFTEPIKWLLPADKAWDVLCACLNYQDTIYTVKDGEVAAFLGYYANGSGFFNFHDDCLKQYLSCEEYCQSKERLQIWQSMCARDTMYIEAVVTACDHRRRGLAEHLLCCAADWARECNLRRLALEVADNNYPAMELYLKCGFTCKKSRPTPCDFNAYGKRLWLEKDLS